MIGPRGKSWVASAATLPGYCSTVTGLPLDPLWMTLIFEAGMLFFETVIFPVIGLKFADPEQKIPCSARQGIAQKLPVEFGLFVRLAPDPRPNPRNSSFFPVYQGISERESSSQQTASSTIQAIMNKLTACDSCVVYRHQIIGGS